MDVHLFAADRDDAAGAGIGAYQGPRHLGAARAHQPGETEDLALLQVEADVLEQLGGGQLLHVEDRLGALTWFGSHVGGQFATHHQLDDLRDGDLGTRAAVHELPVAQDGDPGGLAADLLHAVGDVDDAGVGPDETVHDPEQRLHLGVVESCRRLVHDQDLGVERERLGDLQQLLGGDGQLPHLDARVDLDPEPLQEFGSVVVELLVVEETAGQPGFAADEHVLRRRQVVHQEEFLVDDADARLLGGERGRQGDGFTPHQDLALVGLVEPRENLHQRRLAGAVLADERVHLPGAQGEVDALQRPDPREELADTPGLEQNLPETGTGLGARFGGGHVSASSLDRLRFPWARVPHITGAQRVQRSRGHV